MDVKWPGSKSAGRMYRNCTLCHVLRRVAQSPTQSIWILPSSWMEGHSELKVLSMSFKPGLIKSQAEVPSSPYTINPTLGIQFQLGSLCHSTLYKKSSGIIMFWLYILLSFLYFFKYHAYTKLSLIGNSF